MKIIELKSLTVLILLILRVPLSAQTLYVDAVKGRDDAPGTANTPLASLEKAVSQADKFKSDEPVTVKIAPGLYTIMSPLVIRP
jgi:hypothetical protein